MYWCSRPAFGHYPLPGDLGRKRSGAPSRSRSLGGERTICRRQARGSIGAGKAQLIEETHGHAEILSGAGWIAFEARRRLNGNPCAFQGSMIRNRRGTAATAQPSRETIREVSDGSLTTTRAASGAVNVPVTCPMRRSPWEPSVTTGQPGIPAHLRTSRRRRRPADDLLS